MPMLCYGFAGCHMGLSPPFATCVGGGFFCLPPKHWVLVAAKSGDFYWGVPMELKPGGSG